MADLRGLAGLILLLMIGTLFSRNRSAIQPRIIFGALALQTGIGALVLFIPWGRRLLHAVSDGVNLVLQCGMQGVAFLFGPLVSGKMQDLFPANSFIFALQVLPEIIYVSALIAVLYHTGLMQRFAEITGIIVSRIIGTSVAESFSAVITIFIGQSEMPIAIAPCLGLMTETEIFTVMCSGTASVTGSVLAGYAGLGVPMDYLLAASFMAIPGGLLYARILMPDQEKPLITDMRGISTGTERGSIFEAIASGAMAGMKVAVAVAATLIAFIGLIALLDMLLANVGGMIGHPDLSLANIFGLIFSPLAWIIGIPWEEAGTIGTILGQKMAFNEFVAYVSLSPMIHNATLSPHSIAITSFALCGFSNLSSAGILIGAFGSVAPERRSWIARNAVRAILAGSLSNLTSATIAGLFLA
ncbi:MAG: nucleoside transporter C-terminal domain-containing protein [Acetobacter sp.]